jgi:hypothetical protein
MDEKLIEDWCVEFNFKNYEIKNGLVNVNADVNIPNRFINKIPIQFGIVTGVFDCSSNKLYSLKGSPKKVGDNFHCDCNKLISLKGGPIEVGGYFNCSNNGIISFKYGPSKLSGEFYCYFNPVYEEYKIKYYNYTQYIRSIKLKKLICS